MVLSRRFGFVVAVGLACLALSSRPASALAIMLDAGNDGIGTINITDNGAGDLDSDIGQLLYTGNIAGFFVNLTFATSASTTDSATLTLTQVNVSSTTGGTLALKISDNDYSISSPSGTAEFTGQIGGATTGSGSVTATQSVDLTNTEFGTAGPTIDNGTFSSTSFGLIGDQQSLEFSYISGSTFALTQNVLISLKPGATTSFDIHSIVHAPEPASLALFGSGLVALAAVARRRMRRRES